MEDSSPQQPVAQRSSLCVGRRTPPLSDFRSKRVKVFTECGLIEDKYYSYDVGILFPTGWKERCTEVRHVSRCEPMYMTLLSPAPKCQMRGRVFLTTFARILATSYHTSLARSIDRQTHPLALPPQHVQPTKRTACASSLSTPCASCFCRLQCWRVPLAVMIYGAR